jgi:hypothetical protein
MRNISLCSNLLGFPEPSPKGKVALLKITCDPYNIGEIAKVMRQAK